MILMDNAYYKKLQELYDALTDEKDKIMTLVDMAVEVRNYDVDTAINMADEIIERSVAEKFRMGEGRGLNLKGWCFWRQGNYDEGQATLQKAYGIAREIKSNMLEARVLNNFGYIYRDLGDLATALNYFENALAINERLEDEVAQSVNLSSIAYVHYDLGDYDNALAFALKCMPIFERASDIHRLSTLYNTLGNIYFKLEQFKEALRYFEENMQRTEPGTVMHDMAMSGVGKVYYKMHEFDDAAEYLLEALNISKERGDVEVEITCLFYLGRVRMDEGTFRQALSYLEQGFSLSYEYARRHDIMSFHEMLSLLYDKMGNIPKAFYHLKEYGRNKDEIFQQTTFNKLRNLQSRQQIELAQKEKEVAERTANLKQQFMANMSHEIRTPMNAIVGMSRLLLGKEPRPDQLRYLNAIQQSADNLLVIINDILDLSKIEAGKIVIEQTDFSLPELMHSMSDMLLLKAEEKGIEFRIVMDPAIPVRLIGDPTRVNQVLVNLAGNSIKFTHRGFVEVRASLKEKDGEQYKVQLDVIDTGIGIASEYVEKIFDSFTQAGTDTARKFGGTGLGLTISKQLVTLMNGQITVQSELGKGTTFSVILSFIAAEKQEQEKPGKMIDEATEDRLKKARILLVEDNEFNRMVAEDTLKEVLPGVQIDTAINGAIAVTKVQQTAYDIVLMDIQMPVMDGLTATKKIRTELSPPASLTKIIAMTANVLQEDVAEYFRAGMDAYVSKPFQTDELLLKMSSVLDQHDSKVVKAETPVATDPVTEIALPSKITDLNFLQQFTGGKQEKIEKYIVMFLDNAPRLLRTIEQSLAAKDLPAVKIAAHSLKPQLSYMGVKEEVSHIFVIEQIAGDQSYSKRLLELTSNLRKVCEKAFEELREVVVH